MAQIADRDIGAELQVEIPAPGAQHEGAVDGRCPNDLPVHQTIEVLANGIAVLGGFAHLGVRVRRQQHAVRTVDPRQPQLGEGLSDDVGELSGVRRQRQRGVGTDTPDAVDRRVGVALEDRAVLGERQFLGGILNRIPVGVRGTALDIIDGGARQGEWDAQPHQRLGITQVGNHAGAG